MQSTLADFEESDDEPEEPAFEGDGKAPCPYCERRVARVTMTLASGNLLSKPMHLGPVGDCPAFEHWTFELPWWC